jgi:predicted Zn-dependent protease
LQGELLADYVGRESQKILSKRDALLVGVAQDFYVQSEHDPYPTHYVKDGRLAVVSLSGLDPQTYCEPPDEELLRARLRKLTAKLYANASVAGAR